MVALQGRVASLRRDVRRLSDHAARTYLGRSVQRLPRIEPGGRPRRDRALTHVSAFSYGNAGDTLLPVALRDLWESVTPGIRWDSRSVIDVVDDNAVAAINRTRGVVVGGGGLFLRDTNPNTISGWQWPCSNEQLARMAVPLVLFAVGYNRFRDQPEFDEVFNESVEAFARKALYLGMRNHGSIAAVRRYLPDELHQKVVYQPCPTTVLAQLYPNVADYRRKRDFVALNMAFDRSRLRFGERIGETLTEVAQAVKKLSAQVDIKYYSHMDADKAMLPFLDAASVPYELVDLRPVHPRTTIAAYADASLVIGMRGHAQMVPFGCATPIISLVSHDKMRWFLDDIDHPEWGIELNQPGLADQIVSLAETALASREVRVNRILEIQQRLFALSRGNVEVAVAAMFGAP